MMYHARHFISRMLELLTEKYGHARNAVLYSLSCAALPPQKKRRYVECWGEVSMGFGFTRSAALGHVMPKHE